MYVDTSDVKKYNVLLPVYNEKDDPMGV